MADARSGPIFIAGAGIAGLTAALAFARHGYAVRVFERASRLEEAGAGIQLSPNATRLLGRLGVLQHLLPRAVLPEAVVLRRASDLQELARVPLGAAAEERWGAPYLVIHRADLQRALVESVEKEGGIELVTDATVESCAFGSGEVAVSVGRASGGKIVVSGGRLLVGADGVWSRVRESSGLGRRSFAGQIAWRAMIDAKTAEELIPLNTVSAFLHPKSHLVAYPLRNGAALNLVAIIRGREPTVGGFGDAGALLAALRSFEPRLKALVERAGPWSAWPIHVAHARQWTDRRGLALIGDAAHAMTPFAAQGAAMTIEDAVALADMVAATCEDLSSSLARFEEQRRPRIARVARRGALNRLAWHAWGPVALARDAVLRTRPPQQLAADLDWLYGWDAEKIAISQRKSV